MWTRNARDPSRVSAPVLSLSYFSSSCRFMSACASARPCACRGRAACSVFGAIARANSADAPAPMSPRGNELGTAQRASETRSTPVTRASTSFQISRPPCPRARPANPASRPQKSTMSRSVNDDDDDDPFASAVHQQRAERQDARARPRRRAPRAPSSTRAAGQRASRGSTCASASRSARSSTRRSPRRTRSASSPEGELETLATCLQLGLRALLAGLSADAAAGGAPARGAARRRRRAPRARRRAAVAPPAQQLAVPASPSTLRAVEDESFSAARGVQSARRSSSRPSAPRPGAPRTTMRASARPTPSGRAARSSCSRPTNALIVKSVTSVARRAPARPHEPRSTSAQRRRSARVAALLRLLELTLGTHDADVLPRAARRRRARAAPLVMNNALRGRAPGPRAATALMIAEQQRAGRARRDFQRGATRPRRSTSASGAGSSSRGGRAARGRVAAGRARSARHPSRAFGYSTALDAPLGVTLARRRDVPEVQIVHHSGQPPTTREDMPPRWLDAQRGAMRRPTAPSRRSSRSRALRRSRAACL